MECSSCAPVPPWRSPADQSLLQHRVPPWVRARVAMWGCPLHGSRHSLCVPVHRQLLQRQAPPLQCLLHWSLLLRCPPAQHLLLRCLLLRTRQDGAWGTGVVQACGDAGKKDGVLLLPCQNGEKSTPIRPPVASHVCLLFCRAWRVATIVWAMDMCAVGFDCKNRQLLGLRSSLDYELPSINHQLPHPLPPSPCAAPRQLVAGSGWVSRDKVPWHGLCTVGIRSPVRHQQQYPKR